MAKLIWTGQAHVWCACCLAIGKHEPATVDWPGIPSCHPCFFKTGGKPEHQEPEGIAYQELAEASKDRHPGDT